MNTVCIAIAGAIQAVIPATSFTLAWTHSIEKVRWEETYQITGDRLQLTEARIKGSGAGMEPPPGAVLADGWWHYRPAIPPLESLRLANSDYADDYTVCWGGVCKPLAALFGKPAAQGDATLFPCDRPS